MTTIAPTAAIAAGTAIHHAPNTAATTASPLASAAMNGT